jgi:hypothetical protein
MARPHPTEVRTLPPWRVWVRFSDGQEGVVNLEELRGTGVFRAWDAPGVFEQVSIDTEAGTIAWPGGIDLDPDVLHSPATGAPLPGDQRAAG